MSSVIKIGDKIKPVGIPRYRGVRNGRDIVSIISPEAKVVTVHYFPTLGYFYCNKGICCREIGLPQLRIILPVLVYTTKEYPSDYGAPIDLQYLSIDQKTYEMGLVDIEKICGGVNKFDLSISCKDEKYQSYTFLQMGEARWRKDKAMAARVAELYQQYKNLIDLSVARTIPEDRIAKAIQQVAQSGGQGVPQNYSTAAPTVPAQIIPQAALLTETPAALPPGDQSSVGETILSESVTTEDFDSILDP